MALAEPARFVDADKNNLDEKTIAAFEAIRHELTQPFQPQKTVSGQPYIIVYSQEAMGLANLALLEPRRTAEMTKLLDEVARRAMHPGVNPYRKAVESVSDLGKEGLYLSHLGVALGSREMVAKDGKFKALQERIAEHLRKKTMEHPTRVIRSFGSSPHRWPADQAMASLAMYLYDKNYGTNSSDAPIQAWLDYMDRRATDKKTGLPYSNVTRKKHGHRPRGCAVAWSIIPLSKFAPDRARTMYLRFKEHFFEDGAIVSGFREWPRGVDFPSDQDSGPIILGLGAAASAFGIGAARAMGDIGTYEKLRGSRDMWSAIAGVLQGGDEMNTPLAQAITLETGTETSW